MACHHGAIFFTLMVFWLIFAGAQGRSVAFFDPRSGQPRPTRKEFNYFDSNLQTARLYGKRAYVSRPYINDLLEWIALENKMRNVDAPQNFVLRDENM